MGTNYTTPHYISYLSIGTEYLHAVTCIIKPIKCLLEIALPYQKVVQKVMSETAKEKLSVDHYLTLLEKPEVSLAVRQRRSRTLNDAVSATLEIEAFMSLGNQTLSRHSATPGSTVASLDSSINASFASIETTRCVKCYKPSCNAWIRWRSLLLDVCQWITDAAMQSALQDRGGKTEPTQQGVDQLSATNAAKLHIMLGGVLTADQQLSRETNSPPCVG